MATKSAFAAFIGGLCEFLDRLGRIIVGGSLAGIVVITCMAVWYRYVLDAPLSWTEQVSRILFVWSVFVGAAVLYRLMLHIAIDMFALMLPARARTVLFWINQSLILATAILMLWFGLEISIGTLDQTFGALEISPATFYFAAPACGALIILFWIEKVVDPSKRDPIGDVHI